MHAIMHIMISEGLTNNSGYVLGGWELGEIIQNKRKTSFLKG